MLVRVLYQVRELEAQCAEQQSEITRLTEICANRFMQSATGHYKIYTQLIDHATLKPLTLEKGSGEIIIPTVPMHIDNDDHGALFDKLAFDLSKVENVTFVAPITVTNPWIGIFDVTTNELLVVYKFKRLVIPAGSSLHVTFKSKMVSW